MPVWHTRAVTYGCPCGRSHDWDRLGVIWTSCLLHLQLWESWTAARWRVLRFHTKLQSRHAVVIYPSLDILLTESNFFFFLRDKSNIKSGNILRSDYGDRSERWRRPLREMTAVLDVGLCWSQTPAGRDRSVSKHCRWANMLTHGVFRNCLCVHVSSRNFLLFLLSFLFASQPTPKLKSGGRPRFARRCATSTSGYERVA